jgi:WD40 repeat protein
MESFKNENLMKLVFESFNLCKAKHLFTHSKSRLISKILLKTLNLKKLFMSIGNSKDTIKYDRSITSVIRFSDNNIITTSSDSNIKIISMDNYNCLVTLSDEDYENISSMIFLPNGNILYSTWLFAIKEVDPRKDFSCVNIVDDLDEYDSLLNLLSLPDGRIAFSAALDEDSYLMLLDFNDKYNITKLYTAEKDDINSLINLDKNKFACATACSGIMIWDAGNNGYTCSNILKGYDDDFAKCLLYINEYDSLVSGSFSRIEIWDMSNYESLYTIDEGASCLLYLPNGYFASSKWNKTIKIWNLVNYQCVSVFEGHENEIIYLLVLKDNRIVSASDKEIIIWNNS